MKKPSSRKKPASWQKKYRRPSLLADTPISDPKLDRLGRAGFASSLAASILALKGQDSFVIGLTRRHLRRGVELSTWPR